MNTQPTPQQNSNSAYFGWTMWLIATLFFALDYFLHTAPGQLLVPMSNSILGSSSASNKVIIGNILSIYFPIYAACQIPAGYCLDKFGIKIPLFLACMLVSLGLIVCAQPSITALYIGRALTAMGSSFAFLGALKAASMWLPTNRMGLAVGFTNSAGTILGAILGLPILNLLINYTSWQQALIWFASAGCVLSAIILFCLKSNKNTPPLNPRKKNLLMTPVSARKMLKSIFLALYAGIMVGTIVNAMGETYGITILHESLQIGKAQATDICVWLFIGIAVGGPIHGMITNKTRIKTTQWMLIFCAASCLCYASIITLLDTAPSVNHSTMGISTISLVFSSLLFITGFCVSSMLLSFSWARTHYPKHTHARIFAVINMVIGACGYIFTYFVGNVEKMANLSHIELQHKLLYFTIPLLVSIVFCYIGTHESKALNQE
jgi:MFS family permease